MNKEEKPLPIDNSSVSIVFPFSEYRNVIGILNAFC